MMAMQIWNVLLLFQLMNWYSLGHCLSHVAVRRLILISRKNSVGHNAPAQVLPTIRPAIWRRAPALKDKPCRIIYEI